MRRRRNRKNWFVALGVFAMAAVFTFLKLGGEPGVGAANMGAFDPGYIISDYQMENYNSMDEAQIQSFLKSKNPCDDTNTWQTGNNVGHLSESTPYSWHVEGGHYVCMADENFNGESAAHIIWQAARDYRINPQVLIVLLQKEQGLVTDTLPNSVQYRSAMGYGCPDTAACESTYYGFKNQVRHAASLFRAVLDGGWTNYPVGNNYVRYNPSASCGGSVVNIRNLATSALYRYTPYQPNAAALSSSYGSGDSCSAYGNRNFYSYFEDWFGGITDGADATDIVEGDYVISSKLSSNKVIDISGGAGSAKDGTNIQLYDKNGTDAQKWHISRNTDGTYSIINPTTGKSLDVFGGKTVSGTNVQLYSYNGTCAQKWKIRKNYDGSYSIFSDCATNMALDVSGANSSNGANIQIYESNRTNAQKWKLNFVRVIDDGEYNISSALLKTTAVDISGGAGSAKNGTNIQLYEKNGTGAQRWKVKYDGDGFYSIINPTTGKSLDVFGGKTVSGTNVQLYSYNGTCAQKWSITKRSGGYVIASACSGLALDLAADSSANKTNILVNDFVDEKTSQLWSFDVINAISQGDYVISSKLSSNKVIDISGGAGSAKDGTNIQLYDKNGTDAQKWHISRNTDGTYSIINPTTGKSLDVFGGKTVSGTNVQLYSYNGTCAQKWWIEYDDKEKGFMIFSRCSGLVLDAVNGSMANGTNIQIYSSNGSKAQRWNLTKL